MIEVLKQAAEDVSKAYDVLAFAHTERALELLAKTRTSLRQAIAELESQEPVAWMKPDVLCDRACMYLCTKGFTQFPECATIHPPQLEQNFCPRCGKRTNDIHTCTPPQRTWVGLTDDEIDTWKIVGHESLREFVRAIEAALKERNT